MGCAWLGTRAPRASRAAEWARVAALGVLCAAAGAACDDPLGLTTGDRTYALESIAGVKIPASFTDGTCGGYDRVYPDQKYVTSGKLVLQGTHFDMEYGWVGETAECCFWGPRKGPTWYRTASGEFSSSGSSYILSDPDIRFTATETGDAMVVAAWGQLRSLRFIRR